MAKDLAIAAPNDRESAFIEALIEFGDKEAAVVAAGYKPTNARQQANLLLSRAHVAWALAVATRKRLAESVPMALRTIEELSKSAKSENVRLDASKALLDRAGYVAPRAMLAPSKDEKPLHERTTTELQELAHRLEDEIAGRAKPVNSATAAPAPEAAVDLVG